MRGCKAHTTHTWGFTNRCQERGKALLPRRIRVGVYVLTQELDLGVSGIGHATGLGKDRIRCPAAFFAARIRNNAVRTEFVATLDDRYIAAMRVRAGSERRVERLVGLAVIEPSNTSRSGLYLHEHRGQVAVGG